MSQLRNCLLFVLGRCAGERLRALCEDAILHMRRAGNGSIVNRGPLALVSASRQNNTRLELLRSAGQK